MRFLLSCLRIFSMLCTSFIIWVTLSYFVKPKFSRDICIVDRRMEDPETLNEIAEVLETFRTNGIEIKLSCEDLTAIQISYTDTPPESSDAITLVAVTYVGFLPLSYRSKSNDKIYTVTEVYIPFMIFAPTTIEFISSREDLNRSNPQTGATIFQLVLIHEIGHALGASHNFSDPRNVMAPYIEEYVQTLDAAVKEIRESTYWIQRYD